MLNFQNLFFFSSLLLLLLYQSDFDSCKLSKAPCLCCNSVLEDYCVNLFIWTKTRQFPHLFHINFSNLWSPLTGNPKANTCLTRWELPALQNATSLPHRKVTIYMANFGAFFNMSSTKTYLKTPRFTLEKVLFHIYIFKQFASENSSYLAFEKFGFGIPKTGYE